MKRLFGKFAAGVATAAMLASLGAPVSAQSQESLSAAELRTKVQGLALGQAYWGSRMNFATLSMASGLGVSFMPDMNMMAKVSEMTGVKLEQLPKNMLTLQGVYASGDSHIKMQMQPGQKVDMAALMNDFANLRFDQTKMDKTFIPADHGWTILKLVEWAKDFHNHDKFTPIDPMLGPALTMQSMMMSMWVMHNLVEDPHDMAKMAYRVKQADGTLAKDVRPIDQIMMLWADSDITIAITDKTHYPKYVDLAKMMDPESATKMAMMADMDFQNVEMHPPTTLRDAAFAAQAINLYAVARPEKKPEALKLLGKIVSLLNFNANNPVDVALALRGHAAAYQLTGDKAHLKHVQLAWANLEKFWDADAGVYAVNAADNKYVYNATDFAALVDATSTVRALAAPLLHDPALARQADERFVSLFDQVWNKSGFYSTDVMKTQRAPVMVNQVTYDKANSTWAVTDDRFYTGPAMYVADVMVWLIPGNADEFLMATPKTEPTVLLDGQPITFDVTAQIVNDRTMVPLRGIFEALGAQVTWDNPTQTVTATRDGKTVKLTIGSTSATVNGRSVTLDAAPFLSEERTLIPLRFISEALGAKVGWDGTSYTVSIDTEVQ